MSSIFSSPSLKRLPRSARLFIVRLFGSFLLSSGSVVSADTVDDLLPTIANNSTAITTALATLNERVTGISSWSVANATVQGDIANDVARIRSGVVNYLSYLQYLYQLHNDISSLPNYTSRLKTISDDLSDFADANHTDLTALKSALDSFRTSDHTDQRDQVTAISNLIRVVSSQSPGGSPDILAGNPWWATNSAFALTGYNYSRVYPDEEPNNAGTFSFPQFASKWSTFLTVPAASAGPAPSSAIAPNWFNRYFGYVRRDSFDQANPYTWFDWMSDAMRSNLVVLSSLSAVSNALVASSFSSLTNEIGSQEQLAGTSTDPDLSYKTNALPEYVDLTQYADMSDASSAMGVAESEINSRLQSLSAPLSGSGDSRVVVIPGFTVGGITVREQTFDFAYRNDVVTVGHAIMVFLWRVMLFASLFGLASSEFAYYANLGRTWTRSELIQARWADEG